MKALLQTGRLRSAWQRLRHSERGQGLVEYALIIVVVSLGTIASLTFLRGEIRSLFSRAGSALEAGGGGTGGGGGGGTAPVNNSAPTTGNNPGIVTTGIPGTGGSGGVFSNSITSSLLSTGEGVLTNTQPSSTGCTIAFNNGNTYTFTGTWVPDPPNFPANTSPIWQSGGSGTSYHWACVGSSVFATPANNTSFGAFKEANDDRTDGTFVYFTNIPWHGSSAPNPGSSGVFRTGGSTITSGTKAFFFTSTGIYVCTWGATPTSGSNNHWNQNATHSGGESGTVYTQRCA